MTRLPESRDHASAAALVFRVALLLGMTVAFWLATQWWDVDRANAAEARPETERTGSASAETEPGPLVEPVSIELPDTARAVAKRITEPSAGTTARGTTVDLGSVVEPFDIPDTAGPVFESLEEVRTVARPDTEDTSKGEEPHRERTDRSATGTPDPPAGEATAPTTARPETPYTERPPRSRSADPRAGADPAPRNDRPAHDEAAPSAVSTGQLDNTGPVTTDSAASSAPDPRPDRTPDKPRRRPLPAPPQAPSTAQTCQPNAGTGQRDTHTLRPEPVHLPGLAGTRSQQQHEGLRPGIKAAVPVTTPD